ncbi:MAG: class I SAM-dependent methyltransferase, partial [Caulobacteraceae bacterium]
MRKHLLASAIALSMAFSGAAIAAQPYITAAMADSNRPAKDVELDAARHTAEIIEFTGVKPGDVVVDIIPGGGYWTRIFSKVVGPKGRVIAYVPAIAADKYEMGASANKLAADPALGNVMARIENFADLKPQANVDVVFVRQ